MSFLYRINQESVANSIPCKEGEVLENEIEELLQKNNELVLGEKILYIGRQLKTATGKILDLLAVDRSGRLIVIELKRGYAPREILAQILEYSSWLRKLSEREIENIAKNYFDKNNIPHRNLLEAFTKFFGHEPDIRLGDEIVNVLFAQEFPPDLINSMEYLRDTGLDIECMRFDLFSANEEEQFLLVQKLFADEEDTKPPTAGAQEVPKTQKQIHKQLISQLTKILADKYNDWASSLGDGLWHPFKTWQDRGGYETSSYIDWNFDGGKLCLSCGFSWEEQKKNTGFYVQLWVRKKSDLLFKRFRDSTILTTLTKQLGFYDAWEEDEELFYEKDFEIDTSNLEAIKKVAIEEFDQIKPLIEKILSK